MNKKRCITVFLMGSAFILFGVPDTMSYLRVAELRTTQQMQDEAIQQVKKMIQLPPD